MKKIFLGLVLTALVLGGCTGGSKVPSTTEKLEQNVVTRPGTISTKVGSVYLLSTTDGIVNITSTKVNLDSYLKKSVKVTGMFSGSTLYVDKVESVVTK